VLDQAASGSGNKFLFVSKSANGLLTNGPKSVLTEETWLEDEHMFLPQGTNGMCCRSWRVKAGFRRVLRLARR